MPEPLSKHTESTRGLEQLFNNQYRRIHFSVSSRGQQDLTGSKPRFTWTRVQQRLAGSNRAKSQLFICVAPAEAHICPICASTEDEWLQTLQISQKLHSFCETLENQVLSTKSPANSSANPVRKDLRYLRATTITVLEIIYPTEGAPGKLKGEL